MPDDLTTLPPIAAALSQIPKGPRKALIAAVTQDGVEVSFTATLNKGWSVKAAAGWNRAEHVIVQAEVKRVW